jgi:hypothetical protein
MALLVDLRHSPFLKDAQMVCAIIACAWRLQYLPDMPAARLLRLRSDVPQSTHAIAHSTSSELSQIPPHSSMPRC